MFWPRWIVNSMGPPTHPEWRLKWVGWSTPWCSLWPLLCWTTRRTLHGRTSPCSPWRTPQSEATGRGGAEARGANLCESAPCSVEALTPPRISRKHRWRGEQRSPSQHPPGSSPSLSISSGKATTLACATPTASVASITSFRAKSSSPWAVHSLEGTLRDRGCSSSG